MPWKHVIPWTKRDRNAQVEISAEARHEDASLSEKAGQLKEPPSTAFEQFNKTEDIETNRRSSLKDSVLTKTKKRKRHSRPQSELGSDQVPTVDQDASIKASNEARKIAEAALTASTTMGQNSGSRLEGIGKGEKANKDKKSTERRENIQGKAVSPDQWEETGRKLGGNLSSQVVRLSNEITGKDVNLISRQAKDGLSDTPRRKKKKKPKSPASHIFDNGRAARIIPPRTSTSLGFDLLNGASADQEKAFPLPLLEFNGEIEKPSEFDENYELPPLRQESEEVIQFKDSTTSNKKSKKRKALGMESGTAKERSEEGKISSRKAISRTNVDAEKGRKESHKRHKISQAEEIDETPSKKPRNGEEVQRAVQADLSADQSETGEEQSRAKYSTAVGFKKSSSTPAYKHTTPRAAPSLEKSQSKSAKGRVKSLLKLKDKDTPTRSNHLGSAHDSSHQPVTPSDNGISRQFRQAEYSSKAGNRSVWDISSSPERNAVPAHIDLIKGPFSTEEHGVITLELQIHRDAHNMSETAQNELIHARHPLGLELWNQVCAALPNRKREAIMKFTRRQFHNFEARGKFTEEDDSMLLTLYEQYPKQWANIGAIMGRHPEDCRDRWRNYLVCGDSMIRDRWTKDEEKELKVIVADCLRLIRDGQEENERRKKPGQTNIDLIDWMQVSKRMGHSRSQLQCRTKWSFLQKRDGSLDPEALEGDIESVDLSSVRRDDPYGQAWLDSVNIGSTANWRGRAAVARFQELGIPDKLELVQEVKRTKASQEQFVSWHSLGDSSFRARFNPWEIRAAWKLMRLTVEGGDSLKLQDIARYLIDSLERGEDVGADSTGLETSEDVLQRSETQRKSGSRASLANRRRKAESDGTDGNEPLEDGTDQEDDGDSHRGYSAGRITSQRRKPKTHGRRRHISERVVQDTDSEDAPQGRGPLAAEDLDLGQIEVQTPTKARRAKDSAKRNRASAGSGKGSGAVLGNGFSVKGAGERRGGGDVRERSISF